jgi:hypothetical protein
VGEWQLSKEDEAAAGGEEQEVRREDQDKINKFSRLHQKEIGLEEELKAKHVRTNPFKQQRRFRDHGHGVDRFAERKGGFGRCFE